MTAVIARRLPVFGRVARHTRQHAIRGVSVAFNTRPSNPLLSGSCLKQQDRFGNQLRNFSHKLKCPELGGESITEGTLMEWSKKVGQSVKKGEIIAIIETDKVTIDVAADKDGHLAKVLVQPDETCEVGQELAVIGDGAGSGDAAAAAPSTPAPAAAAPTGDPITIAVTDMGGESITEGTVMPFNFKVGDYVNAGEIIVGIETDKVTVDIAAETGGTLVEILVEADDTAEVGTNLCKIVPGPPPAGGAAPSPAAEPAAKPADASPSPTPEPAVGGSSNRVDRREKLPRMRQAIARNLKTCQTEMAMLSTFQEIDMSHVMALRKEYKDQFEEAHGARLGFMSIFMKASAQVLQQIPSLNAYIDGNDIVYRDYVDIAFAAATPRGLVTPVIRNVESMSILQIEKAFADLVGKARKDAVKMDEMTNMTFTISNGGVFGSMLGTPLIGTQQQAAILGLHATKPRPVVLPSGEIVARPVMYVALTYDHRLVDGREAVMFLDMLRSQMEDARRILLEV